MDIDELVNSGLDTSPPINNGGDVEVLGRKRTREEEEEETASIKRVTKNGHNDDDVEMEDKAGEEGTKNDNNNNNNNSAAAKEDDASEIDDGEVELVSRFSSSQMRDANAVICTSDCCGRVACATLMTTLGTISDVCYDCGLILFGVPVVDLTLESYYTDTIRELSTSKEDLLVQPIEYTVLADLPFEGKGAYSTIPGAAIALNGSLSFSNGRMRNWINNDTIIQLHSSATREDEATYILNTLRNLMKQYKHAKRGEVVRLGNAYEGLDTAGAEESIRNKFMSVVARIEFTHYTDTVKIGEFGDEMLAIWRYHETQADAITSEEFRSIEETLRDAVMRFWTD